MSKARDLIDTLDNISERIVISWKHHGRSTDWWKGIGKKYSQIGDFLGDKSVEGGWIIVFEKVAFYQKKLGRKKTGEVVYYAIVDSKRLKKKDWNYVPDKEINGSPVQDALQFNNINKLADHVAGGSSSGSGTPSQAPPTITKSSVPSTSGRPLPSKNPSVNQIITAAKSSGGGSRPSLPPRSKVTAKDTTAAIDAISTPEEPKPDPTPAPASKTPPDWVTMLGNTIQQYGHNVVKYEPSSNGFNMQVKTTDQKGLLKLLKQQKDFPDSKLKKYKVFRSGKRSHSHVVEIII